MPFYNSPSSSQELQICYRSRFDIISQFGCGCVQFIKVPLKIDPHGSKKRLGYKEKTCLNVHMIPSDPPDLVSLFTLNILVVR